MRTLADLKLGESGVIKEFQSDRAFKRSCMIQGMIKGATVTFCAQNPFGDPHVYSINSNRMTLRNTEAAMIVIED